MTYSTKQRPIIACSMSFLLVFGFNCFENGGDIPSNSGRATIYTRYASNDIFGFSFDRRAVWRYPNSTTTVPDFAVFVDTTSTGAILGLHFARADTNVPTFHRLGQFASFDDAEDHFWAMKEIPDTTYYALAGPVSVGQIWAVRTVENRYAAILVRSAIAYTDSSTFGRPYVEVIFTWRYQPNGTRGL